MQRHQDIQAIRFTDDADTRECSFPTISPISPNPTILPPSSSSRPSNSLATTASPLPLIEPRHSFCRLTHRSLAISDAQAWSQEPQVQGALQQLEAPAAYSQHYAPYASPYEARSFPGPGFGPNVGLRVSDMYAPLPNAGALVDSFLSTHPHDTLSDTNNVELPTNSSIAPALSTLPASVPQQGTPARVGRNRFECEDCHKTFDRPSRLDNCCNLHRGIRPWQCGGRCQDPTCDAKYACVDYLRRHLLSNDKRRAWCPKCNQNISKQNMARHRALCV